MRETRESRSVRDVAAGRAVLFAQLVDDPSGYADRLDSPKRRAQAVFAGTRVWGDRNSVQHQQPAGAGGGAGMTGKSA